MGQTARNECTHRSIRQQRDATESRESGVLDMTKQSACDVASSDQIDIRFVAFDSTLNGSGPIV